MTVPTTLAIWGAILSTILFIVKLYETYRDRNRLHISYVTRKSGYEIMITNLGKTPLKIRYYELFWSQRRLFWKKTRTLLSLSENPTDITIPSYSTHTLPFYEEGHFRRTPPTGKKKMYIDLYMIGAKRPKRLFVFNPHDVSHKEKNQYWPAS